MVARIFTDGGCISKNPSHIGGTFAWILIDEQDNILKCDSGVIPTKDKPVTNNWTEQIAIVSALEAMPDGWSGTVYSDSMVALGRVFKNWREKNLPQGISTRTKMVLKRMGKIDHVLLQGHPTKADLACGIGKKRNLPVSRWNVWCDKACKKAGEDYLDELQRHAN